MMAMLLYPFSCSRRKNLRNFSKDGCMELFYHGDKAEYGCHRLLYSLAPCAKRKCYTGYFLTAANPSPFGPTCVPMTVVTLTIRMSRGTDWLDVCISSL